MTAKRAIGIHQYQIVQQRVEMFRLFPQQHPRFTIGHVSGAHISPQQVTHRIDHHKTLTPFDQLAPIKANLLSSGCTVFDTLGINDGHRG